MATILGTVLIFCLCVLLLAAGPLLTGRPMHGGCASKGPAVPRCADCPKRKKQICPEKGDPA